MIGQFYPALVVVKTGFVLAPVGQSAVNVRATSAATELANDVEWLNS